MNLSMPEPVHQTTYRVLYGDTDAAEWFTTPITCAILKKAGPNTCGTW